MTNSIIDGTAIPLLEKVAVFGERRQTALAANIANIDTPNYKRRDLPATDFQRALREAVASGHAPFDETFSTQSNGQVQATGQANASLSGETSGVFPARLFQAVDAGSPSLTFQDNNNRSVENEMMEMTKNGLMQSFAIELMNTQFGMLMAAIREQV